MDLVNWYREYLECKSEIKAINARTAQLERWLWDIKKALNDHTASRSPIFSEAPPPAHGVDHTPDDERGDDRGH